jgi:predicted SnoaL-like aldol condensation-catalyzing enzyme
LLKSIETRQAGPAAIVNPAKYIQHNLGVADGLAGLGAALQALPLGFAKVNTVRVFQGDFVLTVSEGRFAGKACAYSDLFRVAAGKIAEHWDTIQDIPPRASWKNENGKF